MITLAVLVALAALVDRAPAAPAGIAVPPPHPVQRRIQPVPYEPHVPACAACVCAPARLPGTLLPRTVAGRCRGRPGCTRQLAAAGLSPGYLGPVAVLGLGYGPRNAPCSGPSMRHRPLGAATPCARARACRSTRSMRAHARACRWCVPAEIRKLKSQRRSGHGRPKILVQKGFDDDVIKIAPMS
jgi:hypothetical protein